MNVELHESVPVDDGVVGKAAAAAETTKPAQPPANDVIKKQHAAKVSPVRPPKTTTTNNHDYLPGVFFAVALLISVGLVCTTTERSTAVLAVQALFYVTVVASLVAVFHGRVFLEAVVAGMTYVRNEEDFFAKISSASVATESVESGGAVTPTEGASSGPPTESLFDSSF